MILFILLGLIMLLFIIVGIGRFINAQKFRIRSEGGVQKTDYVTIGKIEQYIQIRGQDISNPVIIVLHGGPGNNMAYYSYYWQADLEEDYTIVHWDQRGCGNTYYRNKEAEKPTFDLLLSDLDELVDYVRAEYGKENVVIMGHSWGTLLGGIYAGKHSEKVSAYVGVGQFNDIWKIEQYAAEEAVRLANAASKTDDAKKIEEQFQRLRSSSKLNMRELLKLRQLTGEYLPEGDNTPFSATLFSPLEGVERLLQSARKVKQAAPSVAVAASGFTWLRDYAPMVAAGGVKGGWFDFAGFGRQWVCDPKYAKAILSGNSDYRKCTTCGGCMALLKNGREMRCVLNKS